MADRKLSQLLTLMFAPFGYSKHIVDVDWDTGRVRNVWTSADRAIDLRCFGLCSCASMMHREGLINAREAMSLQTFLMDQVPGRPTWNYIVQHLSLSGQVRTLSDWDSVGANLEPIWYDYRVAWVNEWIERLEACGK